MSVPSRVSELAVEGAEQRLAGRANARPAGAEWGLGGPRGAPAGGSGRSPVKVGRASARPAGAGVGLWAPTRTRGGSGRSPV